MEEAEAGVRGRLESWRRPESREDFKGIFRRHLCELSNLLEEADIFQLPAMLRRCLLESLNLLCHLHELLDLLHQLDVVIGEVEVTERVEASHHRDLKLAGNIVV